MKKQTLIGLIYMLLIGSIYSQKLMTPKSTLFSDKTFPLQAIIILPIPGMPAVSFCPGYSGHFENLPGKLKQYGKKGSLVSCILIDKKNKKIISNISCSWTSSDESILKIISLNEKEKVKRAYLLIPKKTGKVFLEISMGKEKIKLGISITKQESSYRFNVFNPNKKNKKPEQIESPNSDTAPAESE